MRDIRRRYGHEVADIVDACTDSYDDPPSSWLVRKQQYLEHLPESSPSALRVSLADKVDKACELLYELRSSDAGPMAAAGGRGASQDVSWYYASLARMFEILAPGSRADELSRFASELTLRAAPPARLNASGAPREG